MATHDYVIDNSTGANVRADINNVLAAIVSNNSGSSEPSTTYAYQWWADTNAGVLKIRNSANNAWVTLLELDGTLTLEDGSNSAPAIGFRDDLNTGIFSSGADNLDITCGGTTRANFSSSGLNVTGTVTDDGATHDGDVTFTGASANIVFDKSDNQLEFADNAKAEFGTGGDLEIYHDGTDNHIVSTNGQINIQTNSTENSIQCIPDGQVKLFHDNTLQVSTSSTGLNFADNKKANFGDGSDLSIYHDGSNSYIDDSGTGDLNIRGNNVELHKYTGETYAKFIANGAVELYHDDSKKFETYANGCTVTGNLNASNVDLADDAKARFGGSNDLQIYHDGSHSYIQDAGTGNLRVQTNNFRIENAAGTENQALFTENGAVELYHNNSKKIETTSGGIDVTGAITVNGSALSAGGKLLQVVHTEKVNKFATTSSSFTDVTGLSVSITPAATSNKILVISSVSCGMGGGGIDAFIRLMRGSTQISGDQCIRLYGSEENFTFAIHEFDSPSTTSSVTYKIQIKTESNEAFVNRDGSNNTLGQSSITVIEID